jgi:hypothetical protein
LKNKRSNAQIVFDKLYPSTARHKHYISLETSILNLQEELNSILEENIKKPYSDEFLIGQIYSNVGNEIKDSQVSSYVKCCYYLAVKSFDKLIERMRNENGKLTLSNIKSFKELIKDYIFDIMPFVKFLKRKNPNYVFFDGGKSYSNSTFEIFNSAHWLQYSSTQKESILDQKFANTLSVFALRQALELRMKNSIGIGNILDGDGKDAKIKHDFFPNFINLNLDLFKTPFDNLTYLMKVYKWTNYFIHYGLTPRVWELNFALKYAEPMFNPANHKKKNNTTQWSINGSVIITDLEDVRSKFSEYLLNEKGELFTVEFIVPEAIVE